MALQTSLPTRPKARNCQVEATASWPEPPRAAAQGILCEAEWIDVPDRRVPARPVWGPAPVPPAVPATAPATMRPLPLTPALTIISPTPTLSPGLARLLNAALVDPGFGESFLAAPVLAARWAIESSGAAFGTTLPDPALRLTLPPLDDREWELLSRLSRAETLAVAAQELRRLSVLGPALLEPSDRPVRPVLAELTISASPGEALAGAA